MFLTFGPPLPSGFLRKDPSGGWQGEEVCGTTRCAAQGRGGVECAACKDRGSPVAAVSGGELRLRGLRGKEWQEKAGPGLCGPEAQYQVHSCSFPELVLPLPCSFYQGV